jgi:hypothetical protein
MRHEGFARTLSRGTSFPIRTCPRHPQDMPFRATGEWHLRDNSSLFGAAVALQECAAPMRSVQKSLPREPP